MLKVIYVGHELLGDDSATGRTMENIYGHSQGVDLRQLCLDYDLQYHESKRPAWCISQKKSKAYCFMKKLYRRRASRAGAQDSRVFSTDSVNSHRPSSLVEGLKLFLDLLPKGLSEESWKEIDAFHPDVILTLGENVGTLRLAQKLSKRYDAPIVLHIMDDFEKTILDNSIWLKKKLFQKELRKTYDMTRHNIAISDKMAEEYERRHHVKFSHAMNCIRELHPQPLPDNEKLRFVFSGGLHGGRGESLLEMAKLAMADDMLSSRTKLIVYTSSGFVEQYREHYAGLIELHEYVPRSEMYPNLGKADVLVHVESFEQHEIDYFRYSMSTKIPECMSVGRPILCYGPRDICTVSYIEKRKVGLVAEDCEMLVNAMRELTVNAALRQELGECALRTAEKEHLADVVAERVEDVFRRSVEAWRNVENDKA